MQNVKLLTSSSSFHLFFEVSEPQILTPFVRTYFMYVTLMLILNLNEIEDI